MRPVTSGLAILIAQSLLAVGAAGGAAQARTSPATAAAPVQATAAALGWMAGQWLGKVGDAVVEEHWSAPGAGALMGMFRWLAGDRVSVYEFMLIEDTPAGPVLRLKHFNAGLRGWEEKDENVTLQAAASGDGVIVFERMEPAPRLRITYRLEGGDRLVSVLERWTGETPRRDEFQYVRALR